MRFIAIAVLATLSFISCFILYADDGCGKGEGEWAPPSAGPIITWTAPLCGQGKLVVQPFFFYNRTRGTFDTEGHYKSFTNKETKSQYQEVLFAQYGLTERIEIGGQGIYQQNLHHVNGESASATGFNDTLIFVRYCTTEESTWVPHTAVLFQLKMPTGKYQKLDEGKLGTDKMGADTSPGSYDHGYGINITKKLKPFIFHLDAIYNIPILTLVDGVKTRYGDYVNWDFGIEYFLSRGFNLMVEVNGVLQGDKKEDGSYVPASDRQALTLGSGIGWSNKMLQTLLAYQRTLAGTNADVNDSLVFTFVYTF